MENASKALIIAGAILLSILIIAIGMFIYNGASKTVLKAGQQMSERDIAAFNEKFEPYTGSNISGSDIIGLFNEIQAAIGQPKPPEIKMTISASGLAGTSTVSDKVVTYEDCFNYKKNVNLMKRYKVETEIDSTTKLVNKITIADA